MVIKVTGKPITPVSRTIFLDLSQISRPNATLINTLIGRKFWNKKKLRVAIPLTNNLHLWNWLILTLFSNQCNAGLIYLPIRLYSFVLLCTAKRQPKYPKTIRFNVKREFVLPVKKKMQFFFLFLKNNRINSNPP